MKKIIFCFVVLSFILTACGRDEKPAPAPEQTTAPANTLEVQESAPEEIFSTDTSANELSAISPEESTEAPTEEIKTEPEVQPEPVPQDPILQVVQTLNTLEGSLQRYVDQTGSCKGATIEKLDVDVSLPGYQLALNDKVCVLKAISQQKDTLGTKFSTQLGEHKIYCAPGKGNLCDVAAKQGVARLKTACTVALTISGYKIGEVFKDKGFQGQKLTKLDGLFLTAYQANKPGESQLLLLVDNHTKQIIAIRKKQTQPALASLIKYIEQQGKIKLSKKYSSGKLTGAAGKICGKYDVTIDTKNGEYDWTANSGIVTINIVNKKQMDQLNKKLGSLSATNVLM